MFVKGMLVMVSGFCFHLTSTRAALGRDYPNGTQVTSLAKGQGPRDLALFKSRGETAVGRLGRARVRRSFINNAVSSVAEHMVQTAAHLGHVAGSVAGGGMHIGNNVMEAAHRIVDGLVKFGLRPVVGALTGLYEALTKAEEHLAQCGYYQGIRFYLMNGRCVTESLNGTYGSMTVDEFHRLNFGPWHVVHRLIQGGARVISNLASRKLKHIRDGVHRFAECGIWGGIKFVIFHMDCLGILQDGAMIKITNGTHMAVEKLHRKCPNLQIKYRYPVRPVPDDIIQVLFDQKPHLLCGRYYHISFYRLGKYCYGRNVDPVQTVYKVPTEEFQNVCPAIDALYEKYFLTIDHLPIPNVPGLSQIVVYTDYFRPIHRGVPAHSSSMVNDFDIHPATQLYNYIHKIRVIFEL